MQIISNRNAVYIGTGFYFATDATGAIIGWYVNAERRHGGIATCGGCHAGGDQLSERLETEKLSANQLVPVFGVSVDKMLALTSQTPSINIVNIPMPSAEERAELTAIDRKLDAIAAKLIAKANPA